MESSLGEIFDRMESRLGEILDRMEARLLDIIATAEDKQRAESVSFTTESTVDEHFTEFDDLDKGPVFDADHVVISVFEFVRSEYDAELTVFDTDSDSLDDLPVFDTKPVHDAAPASDYAAFTALKFAIRDPTTDDPNDLADGPVFDTEPVPDRVAVTVLEFAKSELDAFDFDKEHIHEAAESSIDKVSVFGSNVTAPTTSIDAPSTCSTRCLHLAITTDLVYSEMEAGPRYPLCVLFNASCSGDVGRGWRTDLFYEDPRWLIPAQGDTTTPKMGMRSFLSYSVVPAGFEVLQCWDTGLPDGSTFKEFARPCDSFRWDPGSAEGSKFPRFGVKFGFGDGFYWDPGALEGLADMSRFIELTGLGSDFHTAQLGWIPMVLWPQQKCGGSDRIAPAVKWVVARAYTLCMNSEDPASVFDINLSIAQIHPGVSSEIVKQRMQIQCTRKSWQIADTMEKVFWEWLPDGLLCLVCGASNTQEIPPYFIKLANVAFTPDLIAASDCMLGKIGYGTVSEAWSYKLPFVFVRRDYFNEEPFLQNMLEHYQCGIEMIWRYSLTRHWKPYLLTVVGGVAEYSGNLVLQIWVRIAGEVGVPFSSISGSEFVEINRLRGDIKVCARMSYFHETIWKDVSKFSGKIDIALKNIGINERVSYNAPLIQFSSWMGGDRDGNPRVTPEVTRNVCLLARMMVANLYNPQIEDLMFELAIGFSEVPDDATFTDVEQFLEPLELCYRPLCACGDHPVADRAGTTPFRLGASANEALNEFVRVSNIPETSRIISQLLQEIMQKLNINFHFQILSSGDKGEQSDLHALLCGVLQVIIQKRSNSDAKSGGIFVPCGGYVDGKKELVEAAAARLSAPGLGSGGSADMELLWCWKPPWPSLHQQNTSHSVHIWHEETFSTSQTAGVWQCCSSLCPLEDESDVKKGGMSGYTRWCGPECWSMSRLWAVAAWGPGPRVQEARQAGARGIIEQLIRKEATALPSSSSSYSASFSNPHCSSSNLLPIL